MEGLVWEGRWEAQTRGEGKGWVCEETQTMVMEGLGVGVVRQAFVTSEAATQQAALAALSQHL